MKNLPAGWVIKLLDECIEKEIPANKLKIPQNGFQVEGKYPIIDQGAEYIAGFTDDSSKIYKGELPVIIFGDHTRIFKFVDFPFALGADGTKILVPKKILHPKYFYFFLNGLIIENHGYSRHYKFLKEKQIVIPPLPTQKKIAAVLEKAENLREWRKDADGLTDRFLKNTFLDMFGDISSKSKGWKFEKLGNLIEKNSFISYGIVQPGNEYSEGVKIIRPVDITNNQLIFDNIKKVDPEIEQKFKRTRLEGDEILITVRGITGNTVITDEKCKGFNVTRGIAVIRPDSSNINIFYLNEYLKSPIGYRYIQEHTQGATLRQINIKDLKVMPILLPPIELQNKFTKIVAHIEQVHEYQKQSKQYIEDFFNMLMQKSFKGELV